MTSVDNLIVNDGISDLIHSPLTINLAGYDVVTSDKNSYWDLGNSVQRDQVSSSFVHQWVNLIEFGCPFLESIHNNVL